MARQHLLKLYNYLRFSDFSVDCASHRLVAVCVTMVKSAGRQASSKAVKKVHLKTKKTGNNDTTTTTDEAEWYSAESNIASLRRMMKKFTGVRDLSCLDLFGASGGIKNAWGRHRKKAELSRGILNGMFLQL